MRIMLMRAITLTLLVWLVMPVQGNHGSHRVALVAQVINSEAADYRAGKPLDVERIYRKFAKAGVLGINLTPQERRAAEKTFKDTVTHAVKLEIAINRSLQKSHWDRKLARTIDSTLSMFDNVRSRAVASESFIQSGQ